VKIAFVYDAVYPWEKGGAQKRVWELARRLSDDHDVHLYGMHYWEGPAEMEREGVTFHGVCEPDDLYTDGRRSISQAIKFAGQLTPALLREDFDVIDVQQFPYFPMFGGKAHELLRDSTFVVTWFEVWDDYWYDYLGSKGAFGKAVERLTVRLPDVIVPISNYIRDDIRELGRDSRINVVENGVDYEWVSNIEPVETDWDVTYLGRLAEHKHVEWLLDAVKTVSERVDRPVETCIIGDGPERERLERRAAEIGVDDHVTFKGFVEEDEAVIANLAAATMFVLPSIREGFPNTILEANAAGVPSIVVDHPENGSTAVVEDGTTGFIADPNPDSIASNIETIVTDDTVRATLSDGALEYGRAHDWANIVADLEDVYRTATDTIELKA